jgi:hypothetical protein
VPTVGAAVPPTVPELKLITLIGVQKPYALAVSRNFVYILRDCMMRAWEGTGRTSPVYFIIYIYTVHSLISS